MEAATLADQFRDLQLKQHERLKARVAKLHEAKPSLQRPDADGIGLGEDLGLMTATQERKLGFAGDSTNDKTTTHTAPVGGEAPHAAARIKELSQEVEQLKAENERLTSRLKSSEKRAEVAERTLETERETLGGGLTAAQKIVEVSKKSRTLHAELAAERNRVRQLEKSVRTATQHAQEVHDRESKRDAQEGQEDLKLQLGDVQEQLIQAKSKAANLNNQCQQLRHDLKMARLVIAREVGEGVTVGSLLNRQISGWRGRSQQIIILQNKLSQLRKSALGRAAQIGEVNETCASISSREEGGREGRVKARQRAALEKIERERRQNLETVRRELEKVQGECGHFRKECAALRARNKILTEEVKSLKSGPLAPCKRNEQRVVVGGDSTELEQRVEKLEETNQNLRRQLKECKRALHRSQHIQPATSEYLSLPPLVHQQQMRHSRPQSRIKLDRQILSAGTAGAHLEVSSLREAQMLIRLAETDRDRLAELTTTLQQRLASAEEELVRLKTEKMTSRPLALPRGAHQTSSCRKRPHLTTGGSSSDRVSAIEAELVIQRDENAVLRETLAQLRREKLEGARLLHSKLQDTRRMCVEVANSYSHTAQQLQ